jgi:DNA-binding LacI/PurR family transcriptional regulator
MPTMRDVAAAAGVSIQTVSNLVNGRGKMTEGTRVSVVEAMEQLGFHPNGTARGLRRQRTDNLGFLLVDPAQRYLADLFTMEVLAGLGDVARDRGFSLLIQPAKDWRPAALMAPVLERRVDAVALWLSGSRYKRRETILAAANYGFPFLLLGEPLPQSAKTRTLDASSVIATNERGAHELTTHLIRGGRRRFAFLTAKYMWPMIEQRLSGCRRALREHGIDEPPTTIRFGGWDPESGRAAADEVLAQKPPPDALVCGNDVLAIGALRAAKEHGLRVPEDLAVVGFDDFELSAFVDPPLTTVALPGYEMGRQAAQLLIDRLEGGRFPTQLVELRTELRLRQSG